MSPAPPPAPSPAPSAAVPPTAPTAGPIVRLVVATVALLLIGTALLLAGSAGPFSRSSDAAIPPGGQTVGTWSELGDWPFVPLHAAVDGQGRVFSYGRGGNGATHFDVWDPALGFAGASHTTTVNTTGSNLFCSFTAHDPASDGLMVFGGDPTNGVDNEFTLRYYDGTLTDLGEPMHFPRWYPSATTLWDGRILVQGGTTRYQGDPILTPEIYEPGVGWKLLTGAESSSLYTNGWSYPRTWVTPAGKVFGIAGHKMYYINPEGNGSIQELGNLPITVGGSGSSAVMFDEGKVLQLGGSGGKKAIVIDMNFDPPQVTQTESMTWARVQGDATVLADGRVMASGGSKTFNELNEEAYNPEIWDPATGTWSIMAPSEKYRLYHSTAVLLTDASVWVGGGGRPGPTDNLNAHLFYPTYLYDDNGSEAARINLSNVPDDIGYGSTFTATVTGGSVEAVSLVRNGNSTHATNTQTWRSLPFTQTGNSLSFDAPSDAFAAPPGDYMLFALDAEGTPSVASIVTLKEGVTPPEPPTPTPTATATATATATPSPTPTVEVVQPPSVTELADGVPATGVSGAQGQTRMFAIDVPADAVNLSFSISGGTGDGDLYVRYGAPPTADESDCRPYLDGNEETCDPDEATEGRWYVAVTGFADFSGVSLTASYDEVVTPPGGPMELTNGQAGSASGVTSQQSPFFFDVPAGAANLRVTTTGGSGDADLYVRFGQAPTLSVNDCAPYLDGNEESCALQSQAGRWYATLVGYQSYEDVSIIATWDAVTILDSGQTVSVSGAQGETVMYAMNLPGDAVLLGIGIGGGTGDADLYVRQGGQPTASVWDCRPYLDGNEENCNFPSPGGGTYWIGITGYADFADVQLSVVYALP